MQNVYTSYSGFLWQRGGTPLASASAWSYPLCLVALIRRAVAAMHCARSVMSFFVLEISKRAEKCGLTVNTDAVFSVVILFRNF